MSYEYPDYINPDESIDNLISAIRNTLQVWLDVHTDADAWAHAWNIDDNWQYLIKVCPVLSNDYFTFDLRKECARLHAIETIHLYVWCLGCGSILDSGWDCEECEDPDYDSLTDDDTDEFIEWHSMMFDCCDQQYPDHIIEQAMTGKGFDTYHESLEGTIAGIVEEVRDALTLFDNATSNQALLSTAMSSSSILHVNGDILEDWGDRIGLDYNTVCAYRDNGLTALFDKDEIRDFISN